MPTTIEFAVELEAVTCCVCGVVFAFSVDAVRKRRRDHKDFWCPNGHSLSFNAESEEDRLKRQLKEAGQAADVLRAQLRFEADQRQAAERSLRRAKAAHTRTKQRIANGVCPECRRHFADLDEHMHMEHPGYVQEGAAT
jgi:5-methylcytosine-specific restriction endonuclease McrA